MMIDPSLPLWEVITLLAMVPLLLAIAVYMIWYCISTFNETWRR